MKTKPTTILTDEIKGVFFDLYGTLLVFDNFDKANTVWENAFYNLIGLKHNLELNDCKILCENILISNLQKNDVLGLTTYETKIKSGLEKLGIEISSEELKHLANHTVGVWQKEIKIAEDALDVLGQIKRSKITGLITNFDHSPHIQKLLNETGLQNLFDIVIVSDEAGYLKPSPEIFLLALAKSNLKADEVVFVGDNIYDDIHGAASTGMKPVLISRNSKSYEIDNSKSNSNNFPDFPQIKTLTQLLEL